MMNAFWWEQGGATNRGIHWMSWDKTPVQDNFGGMGFKYPASFIATMLGKQAWKFLIKTHSLMS